MPIEDEIRIAEYIYRRFKRDLLRDFGDIISKLDMSIEDTRSYMRELGIPDICRQCAIETGSCCRRFVEDYYDRILLLINMLLNCKVVNRRLGDDYCYFLTDNGCILRARSDVCVFYLCDRILRSITVEEKMRLYKLIGREMGFLSVLRVKLKRFMDKNIDL